MKITFVRNGATAIATSPEFYEKIKDGAAFTADVKIVRCPGLHRKFFKMVRFVLHNLPEKHGFKTLDSLREELMFRAGYFTRYTMTTGEDIYKVRSISFESMDQLEFEEVYNRILDEGCKMLGVSSGDLSAEIEEFS